jgi:triacylglycerol esterase/lipase EstA (alpha/beta hydrolase family)
MLAQLLRSLYLFQVLCGGALGVWLAPPPGPQDTLAAAWLLAPLCALGLPLALQFLVICSSMLRSCPGGHTSQWWRAFWGEFRAAITVFVFRMPWAGKNPGVLPPLPGASPTPGAAALPVLLVHGYICNHRVWDDVSIALRRAGHPVLAIDLEPLFTSIDDYADQIEQAVAQLLTASAASQLALVGHSMGGLVIRAWLRVHGTSRVAGIITLGTPHQGTRMVRASVTANGAQMVWHSHWLQRLQHSETPASQSLLQIALTQHDNVVYPQREQVLSGTRVTEFSGLGHVQLCLDPAVLDWLVQQLGELAGKPDATG